MASNRERQAEEIEAISSICDAEEFFRIPGDYYNLGLDIPPFIDKQGLNVKYSNVILKHCPNQPFYDFNVKYLPPACLRIHLPPDYPQSAPPQYTLNIPWLPPWDCSRVCLKLDELRKENEASEMLFIWQDFLRNEILLFLRYEKSLDVSFLFAVHDEPEDFNNTKLLALSDPRAKNGALFLHPMHYLLQYDESRRRVLLARYFHICEICCDEFPGKNCMEFRDCGHVYCKSCIAAYFATRIREGNVAKIMCPDLHCFAVADSKQIKEFCPDLYPKYEELLLHLTLRTMSDVVFCPRISCQYPVIVAESDALASCRQCEYNFCFYCRKVYHGVVPCEMSSEDSEKLIATYLEANAAQKKLLTKKYGRRQIQAVVENHLTKKYIKNNTKPCPKCHTLVEKSDGCNKMVCVHCKAHFCWLCGLRITDLNSYDHFTESGVKNACYGRLLEDILRIDKIVIE